MASVRTNIDNKHPLGKRESPGWVYTQLTFASTLLCYVALNPLSRGSVSLGSESDGLWPETCFTVVWNVVVCMESPLSQVVEHIFCLSGSLKH